MTFVAKVRTLIITYAVISRKLAGKKGTIVEKWVGHCRVPTHEPVRTAKLAE